MKTISEGAEQELQTQVIWVKNCTLNYFEGIVPHTQWAKKDKQVNGKEDLQEAVCHHFQLRH